MTNLCSIIDSKFIEFYTDIYKFLDKSKEPIPLINIDDLGKIVGIVHSVELRYSKNRYEVVGALIVHTAMDHILINGNKRLSLILAYFSAWYLGISMQLLESNFSTLIKQVIIESSKCSKSSTKRKVRENSIKAFANEIEEYSHSTKPRIKLDSSHVVKYFSKQQVVNK